MKKISRRNFFQKSTSLAAGIAVTAKTGGKILTPQDARPTVKRYKPFGKTGFMVSDVSSGAGARDANMVKYLYDSGINMIDSARQYGNHEEVIGQSWGKVPRDKMFIVSKWSPRVVTADVTKQKLMEELDISLQRLKTDYIDCMMIHSIGNPGYGGLERITNPAIYEAFDEAKRLGKIKWSGASAHSVTTVEEIAWGVDNDRFDVVLIGANFLTHGLEPVLKKAKDKGIATMAMKTMTIYKYDLGIEELKDMNTNARQAVIKWILASDLFDTMVIGMRNYDMVNEYLAVSGTTSLNEEDEGLLNVIEKNISNKYCRPGCGGCVGSCPNDVPVWDVLRYKMYFENYGDEKYAMGLYKQLPEKNSALMCSECSDAPCEGACRYKLPVKQRLLEAHSQLTIS